MERSRRAFLGYDHQDWAILHVALVVVAGAFVLAFDGPHARTIAIVVVGVELAIAVYRYCVAWAKDRQQRLAEASQEQPAPRPQAPQQMWPM